MIKNKNDRDFNSDAGIREVKKPLSSMPPWGWVVVAIVLVAGIFTSIKVNQKLSTCPHEMDALYALRALCNVELAYRDFNEDHRFATLNGLKTSDFVKFGYSDSKIAPGYRVEITPVSYHDDTTHSMVIRMFPLSKTRPCKIFQIGPERRFLEFVPMVNSDVHNPGNWIDASYIEKQLPERDVLPWMGENYAYN